jgi:hypothetical protein
MLSRLCGGPPVDSRRSASKKDKPDFRFFFSIVSSEVILAVEKSLLWESRESTGLTGDRASSSIVESLSRDADLESRPPSSLRRAEFLLELRFPVCGWSSGGPTPGN